jgi:hypothetical protein
MCRPYRTRGQWGIITLWRMYTRGVYGSYLILCVGLMGVVASPAVAMHNHRGRGVDACVMRCKRPLVLSCHVYMKRRTAFENKEFTHIRQSAASSEGSCQRAIPIAATYSLPTTPRCEPQPGVEPALHGLAQGLQRQLVRTDQHDAHGSSSTCTCDHL